jgi:hypothetical protein
MGTIWIQKSSRTNCMFHILREVGAELNVYGQGLLTLLTILEHWTIIECEIEMTKYMKHSNRR